MRRLSTASFRLGVAPESGADATVYWLVPSATQIKRKADGTHLPEYVSCESKAKTGEDSPVSGVGTIKFVFTYKSGSTSAEFIYASRIIVTADMAGISFRLYVGGIKVDEKTVLVVDDGGKGEDGKPGINKLPFPAGIWNANTTYTATDDVTPYVYYEPGETYYVMRKNGSVTGLNPVEDYGNPAGDPTWIPYENLKAVFAEIFMANFAKLAGAVFYGNYMFSQHGKDGSGKDTDNYKAFDPNHPDRGSFVPNYCLDTRTGNMRLSNVTATGNFITSPILVTENDPGFGDKFASKSGIYAASIPEYDSIHKFGYASLALGFIIGIDVVRWTDITITNVSDTPLFIDTAFFNHPHRVFAYNGKLYYGVRFRSKYKPVRFMLLKVPYYQMEYGTGAFEPYDRIIQVEGNGLIESTINHFDDVRYSILQI